MRTTLSILGVCAALVMCAVSGAMNFLFLSSLGKTPLEGQVLGAASAAADLLKALLPFFIAWSWTARRYVAAVTGTIAFVFFAGFSLLSAIGFAADNRGTLVETREVLAATYRRVQTEQTGVEARRSALPVHRPVTIVTEELESHRQNRRWSATKECQDATEAESRDYCSRYFALRGELAAGVEADRLTGVLATLNSDSLRLRIAGAEQDRDPQVSLLSSIFGQPQESVRLALIIVVAFLVEIGSALGLFLATGHGSVTKREGPMSAGSLDTPASAPIVEASAVESVEDFCLEVLVPSDVGTLTQLKLCEAYEAWCLKSGRTPVETEAFTSIFSELSAIIGLRCNQGDWAGLALKHDKGGSGMISS